MAYSYGTEQADGSVLVRSGQNVGRWGFFRFHPTEFLLATSKAADFSSAAARQGWNNTRDLVSGEYVTTCVYFRHLAPPDLTLSKGKNCGVVQKKELWHWIIKS